MDTERRRILEAVKDGSMGPEQALRILEELEWDPEGLAEPSEGSRRGVEVPGPEVGLLRVEHEMGTVRIRGDASVARFRVSGPHSVQEDGPNVTIKGDSSFVGVGFVMGPGERRPHWRWPRKDRRVDTFLNIDVNPSIPLDVHLDAGRLQVAGVRAPITGHVDLGTLDLKDFEGSVDLKVDSGRITVDGVVSGRSTIACELGKVMAQLDPRSDVKVEAHCSLGSVVLGGSKESKQKRGGVGSAAGFVVGEGSGELDVRVECGAIRVAVK